MSHDKAEVRKKLEALPYVSRTWIEWELNGSEAPIKVLVVEVTFDPDPNSIHYSQGRLDEIEETAKDTLNAGTMVISKMRIRPRT